MNDYTQRQRQLNESEIPEPPNEDTNPCMPSDTHAALVSEIGGSVARMLLPTLQGIHAELKLIRAENEQLRNDVANLKQGLELQQARCIARHSNGADHGLLGTIDGNG